MAQDLREPLKPIEAELESLARLVKPKLLKYMADISGPYRSRTPINGGNDFAGLRDYRPGDEIRSINWRASARSRQFQVHQHQQERSGRWFICLDISASMRLPEPNKWRMALQLTDALAYILLISGHQTGLLCFSDKINASCPAGSGRLHYKKIHQILQPLLPAEKGGNSLLQCCLPLIKQMASIIVISDFLHSDFMIHGLDRLRKAGHHLQALQILCRHETHLPSSGLLKIFDIESGDSLLIDSNPQTQELAGKMLHLHIKELEAYCRRNHMDYSLAWGDQYWKTALLNHLSHL